MAVAPSAAETEKVDAVTDVDATVSLDANAAPPSTADDTTTTGDTKPKSVLDAVKDRLKADGLAEASPASTGDRESADAEGKTNAKPEGDAEDKPEGEGKDEPPPFHKHPAWKRVIGERDGLKARLDEVAPKVQSYDQMVGMMRDASLSTEEVDAGFNIMALMKNDPHKALATLQPYYDALLQVTGNVLPADLTERVDAGRMTEEDARELARTRADAAAKGRQADAERQRSEHSNAAAIVNDMATGATEWEAAWQAKDPDYDKKVSLVEAQVKAMRADNPPRNRAEAIKLCNDALAAVNAHLAPMMPRKPEIKPQPSESSAKTVQAPRNPLEAARAALANMA